MINKNFYRKTNDKKILHKVGKQWKVVSVALLLAIGGGAAIAATHTNANADVANDDYTGLNASAVANPERLAPASASASTTSASSSAQGIHYYAGHNGTAASYFDDVTRDNSTASKYYPTVNSYVQSLTAEYGPQVKSFAAKSASAKTAASNDSKLAKSYGATAKKNATFNTVNSLAARNHMDPAIYKDMVQDNEQVYSNEVSNASDDVKAVSDVSSLVNLLEGTNLSAASLSASAAYYVASSNYVGAQAIEASIDGLDDQNGATASNYLNIADKLSAGVPTLEAQGDPQAYNADITALLKVVNPANQASAQSAVNSAVASEVSYNKSYYNSIASESDNYTDLSSYAEGTDTFDQLVNSNDAAFTAANTDLDGNDAYFSAVSAGTAEEFAPVLASAATSLYGRYNPELANYNTRSAEYKSASASAAHRVTATRNAWYVAGANYSIIDNISDAVGNGGSNAAASVVSGFLNEGVSAFAMNSHITSNSSSNATIYTSTINNYPAFVNAVTNNDAVKALLKDTTLVSSDNESAVASNASKLAGSLTTLANSAAMSNNNDKINNNAVSSASFNAYLSSADNNNTNLNAAVESAISMNSGSSMTTANIINSISNDATALSNAANTARFLKGTSSNGLSSYPHTDYTTVSDADYDDIVAALLSDGVDYDTLSAESGAIDDVKNAVNSANTSLAKSANYDGANYAMNLTNALNVVSSSANSALTSANNTSAAYSAANDEDVTLASYFASSYASDADVESDDAVSASSDLNTFFINMASDTEFANADNEYATAEAAASSDYKMGVANAQYVYNHSYHFLDVLKGARLHSTPNFGSDGDKVVGSVNKGDRLTVYGVNVSRNHDWRGVIRYFVKDNTNGAKGFFTGQPNFSKGAYLSATTDHNDVEVKTLKPVQVYSEINGKKAIATIPAGKVVNNADVVYDNDSEDAYGFTKVETPDYHFFTANSDYVEIVVPTMPKNNTQQNNSFNFNLQNPDQHMADYYNNLSQD